MRTDIGRSAGQTARQASNTSSGKRARLSRSPPYASVRRLVSGDRNDGQQVAVRHVELEQVEARRAAAPRAAATNWSRTASMSARSISRGTWLTPGR